MQKALKQANPLSSCQPKSDKPGPLSSLFSFSFLVFQVIREKSLLSQQQDQVKQVFRHASSITNEEGMISKQRKEIRNKEGMISKQRNTILIFIGYIKLRRGCHETKSSTERQYLQVASRVKYKFH